jgi:tetratricopeptide (TPR) repeat protein
MKAGLRVRMGTTEASKSKGYFLIAALMLLAIALPLAEAQETHRVVRHHRVEEQDPAAVDLANAETAIDKHDYTTAEPLLKKYLESHADSYSAWYDLGFVYHATGRSEDSIAAYRKSVKAKPDVFESNLNLGLALADSEQPEAEQFFRAATKLKAASNPVEGRKRAWMALARFLQASKPDDAVVALREAAAADPKDAEPHLMAGSLLEKLQRPADAEQEYRQALAVAPDSPDALIALTNLYSTQRRFADAEAQLRRLVAVRPNDPGVHMQFGRMLAIAGKNDEAIAELETGLRLDPNDAKAQRDLADLYSDAGKYEQARQMYGALLAVNPNDAGLHYGFGRALLKQKKFPEAQQELVRAVQLKPDLGEAYGDLAVAANENKEYAVVIRAADLRSKYLPDIPISYFLRATAYDHLRDVKQATKYYHQFLEAAAGKYPEQEWQATHRLIALEPKK